MKRILDNPVLFGIAVFFLIVLGGSLVGFIVGMIVVSRPCERLSPADLCDGGAMAAGFIWSLSFTVSEIIGLVVGTTSSAFLWSKQKPR